MTLADFNLRRAALFYEPVYLCELRWHFPVDGNISAKKPLKTYNHYKATIPANLHSLTVYFAMLKKNYAVIMVILVLADDKAEWKNQSNHHKDVIYVS